jgi:hypothetical protein
MITPAGAPAWSRAADHTDYGGHINKRNYQSQGAVNPETDITAEQVTRTAADLAAVTRVAPFAVLTITTQDPGPPSVDSVRLMTGALATAYAGDAAPSGYPSAALTGTDETTVTFASSYSDEYSVAASFTPQCVQAFSHDGATQPTAEISGQTIVITTGSTPETVTLTVW